MTLIKKVQITKAGFESLGKELEMMKEEKRPKFVERLANARAEGDLSENSDYINAKEELEFLDGRIAELEEVVRNAEVVSANGKRERVAVGTTVAVKVNGDKHVYDIVGEWEANPKEKKISHNSPLGLALSGKKKGERVEVEAPAGKVTYEIVYIK